jgi:uncharacterized membrane protein
MNRWTIPTVYAGGSLAVAMALPRLEYRYLPELSHGMSVASATAFLSAAASGIITFTAIVVSIAFVIIQFSAIAYSPRLALWFVNRPQLYHALGVFISTFTFAMATLAWTDRNGSGRVPFFSTLIVLALLAASMIIFARLVQEISQLQITEVLALIGNTGRVVVAAQRDGFKDAGIATLAAAEGPDGVPVTSPSAQALLHVGAPRSVTSLDARRLVELAIRFDCRLIVRSAVGDTVLEGDKILVVEGASQQLPEQALRKAIRLGRDRTLEQDPKFAIRILVDIAIKALSPAINDPTTAVQALDQIEDLLRRLGNKEIGSLWLCDSSGGRRIFVPMPTWEDYTNLAFDEIGQYGVTSIQVCRRLILLLDNLCNGLSDAARQSSVRRQRVQLETLIRDSKGKLAAE